MLSMACITVATIDELGTHSRWRGYVISPSSLFLLLPPLHPPRPHQPGDDTHVPMQRHHLLMSPVLVIKWWISKEGVVAIL